MQYKLRKTMEYLGSKPPWLDMVLDVFFSRGGIYQCA